MRELLRPMLPMIVILAIPFPAVDEALREMGDSVQGKPLVDATNALTPDYQLAIGCTTSGAEELQKKASGAKVVKAFNTVGNAFMFRPDFPGGPPDMFIAGNSDEAKNTVRGILRDFGWGVVDVGGIEASRYLEAMCMVWVLSAIRTNNWNQSFKMLRK